MHYCIAAVRQHSYRSAVNSFIFLPRADYSIFRIISNSDQLKIAYLPSHQTQQYLRLGSTLLQQRLSSFSLHKQNIDEGLIH
jgi:hypothetical protein